MLPGIVLLLEPKLLVTLLAYVILRPWVKKLGQLGWVTVDPTKCHEGLGFSWNAFVAQFIAWLHENQLKSMAAGGQTRGPGTALFGGTDPL